MEKAFTRPYEEWQNLPLQTTPFTAEVMNNYDDSIEEIDNRVVDLSESNVELTKAEYDALPDEKLTNNVNYFIKDWDGEFDNLIVPLNIEDVFTNLEHVRIDKWHAYKIANKIVVITCSLICTDSWPSSQTTNLGDLNPQNKPLSSLVKTSSYSTNYTQIFLVDDKLKIRPVDTNMGSGFTSYFDITYICG